jgi:hypothetical protein
VFSVGAGFISDCGLAGIPNAALIVASTRRCVSCSLRFSLSSFAMGARSSLGPHRYPPVGRCIYCGATSYSADSTRPLAEEHIIPFALSGELVLPEASCRACEVAINTFEQPLLKYGALLGACLQLDLKTRNRADRPRTLPIFDVNNEPGKRVSLPLEEHPTDLILPALNPPNILTGAGALQSNERELWAMFFQQEKVYQRQQQKAPFATAALDTFALFRLLAKIGHSVAVAERGLDGFNPLLVNFILGNEIEKRFYYVGGPRRFKPAYSREGLHDLTLLALPVAEAVFLIARVRLFAQFGAPIYYVVVGTLE